MRIPALVIALSATLLLPPTAAAASTTAPEPLLPNELVREHHGQQALSQIQVAGYPEDLLALSRLLDTYTSADDAAVHAGMIMLYQGHGRPDFLAAVRSNPTILTSLHRFVVRHRSLFGTDRAYLVLNGTRELGRFLQHKDIAPRIRPLLADLTSRSNVVGRLAPMWMGVAEMVDYYDKANCARYRTCDFREQINRRVLRISHTCSPALRIRAQQLTAAELRQTCTSLAGQDAVFHGVVRDPGPVAGDNNTTLEVVVFNSSNDYRTYAGALYGISTNNGGMYLEGDPAANQARFVAHEADWLPTFAIWNLNHEYTHYLDGRFNMHGDFAENMTTPTVWWIEGFAEYLSYSYRGETYDDALAEAKKRTYALSALFGTTYDHDAKRVYNWGYLAARYLVERHPGDVATVLGHYRAGNWNAARDHVSGLRYDTDWYAWLDSVS